MSKPSTITIDDVQYVRADSVKTIQEPDSQYHIIRGDRSGVFMGIIESQQGSYVKIRNCRRLWYWDGAASLSQLSTDGVSKPSSCKFPAAISMIQILDAIEIIPCTSKAVNSINTVEDWSC